VTNILYGFYFELITIKQQTDQLYKCGTCDFVYFNKTVM